MRTGLGAALLTVVLVSVVGCGSGSAVDSAPANWLDIIHVRDSSGFDAHDRTLGLATRNFLEAGVVVHGVRGSLRR